MLNILILAEEVSGVCVLSVKALQDDINLRINARSITIYSTSINGQDIPYTRENGVLQIEKEITEGEEYQIEITYSVNSTSPSFFYTPGPSPQVLLMASDEEASHWMPCVDSYSRSKWDLELSVPHTDNDVYVVCSGALVQQVSSGDKKMFTYKLDIAVPACKVGFIAGRMEMVRISGIPNAHLFAPACASTSAAIPQTSPHQRFIPTLDFVTRSFGYYNWLLNTRYPWAGFYLVFAKDLPFDHLALPNLIILPSALLHEQSIIDQTWESRQAFCRALIEQYYFCKVLPPLMDRWIVLGLTRYLAFHQLRVFHGNNDYRFQLRLDVNTAVNMDGGRGPLLSEHRSLADLEELGGGLVNAEAEWISCKSRMVLVLLEQSLGKQSIQKILMQLYIDANSERNPEDLFTVPYLVRCIKRITGKEMRGFFDQWVSIPGHPIMNVNFSYNRKKSCVEVDVRQTYSLHQAAESKRARFSGPLLIRIHETESAYDHVVHIEDVQHHFELPFHTKIRKPRQPRTTKQEQLKPQQEQSKQEHEEVDDESLQNKVSPVSWVRIDPELEWIASVQLTQPDVMWIEQLENDRDVIAQWDAIQALSKLPSEASCFALERSIADFKAFYKIRAGGLIAMASCSSPQLSNIGGKKLLDMYCKRYGLKDGNEVIPRANNFENLSNYYLLLAIPDALASIADLQSLQCLLGLLQYNDNSGNAFSDYTYLSKIIECLARGLAANRVDVLVHAVIKEFDRYAFLDRILPSHRNTITSAVVNGLCCLQKVGMHSMPLEYYQELTEYGNYLEVRLAASRALLTLDPVKWMPTLLQSIQRDPSKAYSRALSLLLKAHDNMSVDQKELIEAAIPYVTAKTSKERLQQILNPVIFTSTQTPTAPMIITLPSPKKTPVPAEADWITEISEGVPVGTLRKETTFIQPVPEAIPKAPKLRLAINPVQMLKDKFLIVLDSLWENPDSYPFRYPVDSSVPHYYDIVRSPMDLSTLRSLTDSLKTPMDFVGKLRLIFDNCALFNHNQSLIYAQAKELRKIAVKELKRVFPDQKQELRDALTADIPMVDTLHLSTLQLNEQRFDGEHKARDLLNRLKGMPQSFWFLHPVDPVALNIPMYYEVIKEPMDFGTISGKLDTSGYTRAREYVRDLKLVFANCYRFNNPNDPVCMDARVLEKIVYDTFPEESAAVADSVASGQTGSVSVKTIEKPVNVDKLVIIEKPKIKLKIPVHATPDLSFESTCQVVLDALMASDQSGPFRQPVTGIPAYTKLIKRPMDLGTVVSKLHSHAYTTPGHFKSDLDLIFANCYKFNGREAPISNLAKHLEELTNNLWNEFGL